MTIDELREELSNILMRNNIKRNAQVMFVLPLKNEDEEDFATYDVDIEVSHLPDKQSTPYIRITLK